MGEMCYICRRKASRLDRISLHRFPKNPIARSKWIKACDLSPSDNLSYIYICSVHFNAKDIDRGNKFQSRCILRTGAVPSIGVPNHNFSNNDNMDTLNGGTEHNAKTNVDNTNTFDNVFENMHVQELQLPTHASDKAPIQQYDDFVKRCRLFIADATPEFEVNENVRKSEVSCSTTPKRRVFQPRYISEIRTPDVGTPKSASRILSFVRDTDKRKTKLIRSLQDRNRKFEKRISSLKKIIADLKKKNIVSNEIGDTLHVKKMGRKEPGVILKNYLNCRQKKA